MQVKMEAVASTETVARSIAEGLTARWFSKLTVKLRIRKILMPLLHWLWAIRLFL